MNTQVEAVTVKEAHYKPHNRLTSVTFESSVPFAGESMSCQVGRNCDAIAPARLEPDGTAVRIEKGQAAQGLLISRRHHDRASNQRFVDQVYVPMYNVKALQYSE